MKKSILYIPATLLNIQFQAHAQDRFPTVVTFPFLGKATKHHNNALNECLAV